MPVSSRSKAIWFSSWIITPALSIEIFTMSGLKSRLAETAAGNVIPDDFATTPEGLAVVRRNILKAGIVGRLVANDFSGAIISAELMEFDPTTGKRLDFLEVAKDIETRVRDKFDADAVPGTGVDVHIIGFAKVMGDMASGAQRVVLFFLGSFFLTGALVFLYAQSHRLAFLTLSCAALAAAACRICCAAALGVWYGKPATGL